MTDAFGPEISDLVVDYDPVSLERRSIAKSAVIARFRALGRAQPLRVVEAFDAKDDVLDPDVIDGALVRSHLELQRLHEEFRVGRTIRTVLAPLIAMARASTKERPIRIVDIGCGMGFIARWLAARGELGDDVEIVGVDYNRALVLAATELAKRESLHCRFRIANAFRLEEPAHIYLSTGVLHHFRGDDLTRFFQEHARAGALAFAHVDIRPSVFAPIGSWIFHRARMREPLARWDGYWSAVRAHPASTIVRAIHEGAPSFRVGTVDATPGIYMLVRIFQCAIGVSPALQSKFTEAFAPLGRRFSVVT